MADAPFDDESRLVAAPTHPIPELLDNYRAQRSRVLEQSRELARLREHVRLTAEREAASIVADARRQISRVLQDARRELLVLAAQVQAAGCEAQPKEVMVASPDDDPTFAGTREIISGARQDVREVLLEARSDVMALSKAASQLRAHAARRSDPELEPSSSAHGVVDALPRSPSDYAPLPPARRVWIAMAASVAFVVGVVAFLVPMAIRTSSSSAPVAAPAAPAVNDVAHATKHSQPTVPPAAVAVVAADPSRLSLTLDVRRQSWLTITVDGRREGGRMYEPGQTRTIIATRSIVMRAGDAGAVLVSVDGAAAVPFGGNGEVVTRRFVVPLYRGSPSTVADGAQVSAPAAAGSQAVTPPAGELAAANIGTSGADEAPQSAPDAEPAAVPDEEADDASAAEAEIRRLTQQWFEAYFSDNRGAMAAVSTSDFALTDRRSAERRMPSDASGILRTLEQVHVELAGDGGVLTARLIERGTIGGQMVEYASLVSEVWMRREGRWWLTAVSLADADVPPYVARSPPAAFQATRDCTQGTRTTCGGGWRSRSWWRPPQSTAGMLCAPTRDSCRNRESSVAGGRGAPRGRPAADGRGAWRTASERTASAGSRASLP